MEQHKLALENSKGNHELYEFMSHFAQNKMIIDLVNK